MQKINFLLILLIGMVLLVVPASAGLTSEAGETWIKWEWYGVGNSTAEYDVYLDDECVCDNTSIKYYYLTDISSHEEHILELYNSTSGELVASNTAKTLTSIFFIVVLLIFAFILAMVTVVIQEELRVIVCGGFCEVICLYNLGLSYGYGLLWMVVVAVMVFQAVFVIRSLYSYGMEVLAWW